MAASSGKANRYNTKMLAKPKQYANGYFDAYEFERSSFTNNVLGLKSRYTYEEQNRLSSSGTLAQVKFVAASKQQNDDEISQQEESTTTTTAAIHTCNAADEIVHTDDEHEHEHTEGAIHVHVMQKDQVDEHPSLLTSTCNLSIGQCKRYLRLLQELYYSGGNTYTYTIASTEKRREFKALKVLVGEERARYRKALLAFRKEHVQRFLIGFRGGAYMLYFFN